MHKKAQRFQEQGRIKTFNSIPPAQAAQKHYVSCDSFSKYNPVGTWHFIWHILNILSSYSSYHIKFCVDSVTSTLPSFLTHFIRVAWLQHGSNTPGQGRVTALAVTMVQGTWQAVSISALFDFSASKCKMESEVVTRYTNFRNKSKVFTRSPDSHPSHDSFKLISFCNGTE